MKIRILHVITGLEQGGAEAMLIRLLRALDRAAFDQALVSLTSRGIYGDLVEDAGIPMTVLGIQGAATLPRGLSRLVRAVRLRRPHIVQTWLYHADLLGLLAARLSEETALVWNIRCALLSPGDVPASTRLLVWLLAKFSRQPDAVVFNSMAGMRAHHAIAYRPMHTEVIPNGFDLQEWRPDSCRRAKFRSILGVGETTLLVGIVGRYHRMKDHGTFLAAAAHVRRHLDDVRFVMVGAGMTWRNTALSDRIDLYGLRNCLILLGSRNDVPNLMAGLDCLALTSTSEGFPNVLGEAMASGVPCIATDAGDARVIVGDTGNIVPIGDAEGIARAILSVHRASRDEKSAMAIGCRARIAEHFEISHVVSRYAVFYNELNEQRKRQNDRKSR